MQNNIHVCNANRKLLKWKPLEYNFRRQSTCIKNHSIIFTFRFFFDMPLWKLLLAFQIHFGYAGLLQTAAQGAGRLCDG